MTALMKASKNGDLEIVQALVAARAILDLKSKVRKRVSKGGWREEEGEGEGGGNNVESLVDCFLFPCRKAGQLLCMLYVSNGQKW